MREVAIRFNADVRPTYVCPVRVTKRTLRFQFHNNAFANPAHSQSGR